MSLRDTMYSPDVQMPKNHNSMIGDVPRTSLAGKKQPIVTQVKDRCRQTGTMKNGGKIMRTSPS